MYSMYQLRILHKPTTIRILIQHDRLSQQSCLFGKKKADMKLANHTAFMKDIASFFFHPHEKNRKLQLRRVSEMILFVCRILSRTRNDPRFHTYLLSKRVTLYCG